MTWLVESPWPWLILGTLVEVALAIALVRTGRARLLVAMAAVGVLTMAMVLMERIVVTEREELADTLDAVASALVTNDQQVVLAAFSPKCPQLREIRAALSRVTIRSANVGGDLDVKVNQLTNPPSAVTYFTGRIDARDKKGEVPYEHLIRKFKVTLHREGDRWLIFDVSDDSLRGTKVP